MVVGLLIDTHQTNSTRNVELDKSAGYHHMQYHVSRINLTHHGNFFALRLDIGDPTSILEEDENFFIDVQSIQIDTLGALPKYIKLEMAYMIMRNMQVFSILR